MKKILLILISVIALNSQSMAYEEANYEVVKENKNYEIRKYSDRLVVETNSIQGNGFRKLFNYISGNNEQKEEIKMTVPVTQEIKNGNMTMQFYLPSKFNKDNTPKPSNSEIEILMVSPFLTNLKGPKITRYACLTNDSMILNAMVMVSLCTLEITYPLKDTNIVHARNYILLAT